MKKIIFLLLILLITSHPALSYSSEQDNAENMEPLNSELLSNPIILQECHGLTIIEWRATPNKKISTSPNTKSIKVMNDVCKLVFNKYPIFIKREGLTFSKNYLEATQNKKICIMPADINDYGKSFRNLNDLNFRFKDRSIKNGKYVWGFYNLKKKMMFIENDIINESGSPDLNFQTTFAHELYHIISAYTGIYYKIGVIPEENMAERFTEFIGFEK